MESVRIRSGLMATAFVSSTLAATMLPAPPTANATCFSIFGIGNGNGCTSNLTSFALGIGDGAVADASTGFFGGAFAVGANARATTSYSAFTLANAMGNDAVSTAMFSLFSFLGQIGTGATSVIGGPNLAIGVANGNGAQSTNAIGGFNLLAHYGPGSAAAIGGLNLVLGYSGGDGPHHVGSSGLGNIGVQLGPGSTSIVGGINLALGASPFGDGTQTTVAGLLGTVALNLLGNGSAVTQGWFGGAVNILGSSSVEMAGIFATALNILGNGNQVRVLPQALLSVAFGLLSNDVTVTAGPGPLSFSGALFQNGMAVGQTLRSAIEDMATPVDGATRAASQNLGNALSAASAGDLAGALAALGSLPRVVLNAFLYGYDPDDAGPAGSLPGLFSAKGDGHNGGPIYQLFVGLPAAIKTAVTNIGEAATADTAAATDSASSDDPAATAQDTPVHTAAPGDSEEADDPSDAVVADVKADDIADGETGSDVIEPDDVEPEDPEPVDDEPDVLESDSAADTSDAEADNGSAGAADADGRPYGAHAKPDDADSGSSSDAGSDRPGKHRAGPRHAA